MTDPVRKAFAELVGSALLAATVVSSGIAAQRLSPGDVGLQLLENALITGAVLVALILALGPVSAAFNPMVTLAERALGAVSTAQAALYVAAQVAGCCLGVVVANLMFALPAVDLSGKGRGGGGLWLGEVVATFGLLVVVLGVIRSGHRSSVAYAVGGYITAAVLHDLNLACRYADVVVAMRGGQVVASGTPAEVVIAERVLEVFGLSAVVLDDPVTGRPLVVPALPPGQSQ